ncbi:hypothetical protein CMV30_06160 [Nibricoccus aquaticus]|uniref:Uncharacterized protein n=2 Tax=Nibricoccus aquaticus TaxID=2576891 RepID=A0A290Q8R3_9BACT|nr:hypothetical protein CMV30_06160 [Nibricoccus aquaticus]
MITMATIAYGVGPFITDMNKTHLLHPGWTGHARFHLFWAASSQLAVASVALWLLWGAGGLQQCQLAVYLGLAMNSGFFAALLFKKYYRGALHDPQGIRPILGKIDGNILAVIAIVALLLAGWGCLD